MATAETVVVELRADVQNYLRNIRQASSEFERNFGQMEASQRRLEQEMRASQERIGGSLKTMAASLAGAFTGRELINMVEAYTTFENKLKVAGVAAEQMGMVQDRLMQSAQKYGVEIGALGDLFGTLTNASKELGASQEQMFQLTDSVSAALKVSGMSATEASGALLQLGQALRGGKLQAEEYNSLLDGMFPLLEAAARGNEKWGGSVAKLTADVKAGKVSSAEFLNAILAGSSQLESQAAIATDTLSQSVTKLTNQLTIYVGEANKSYGVSGALAGAIGMLADNLDTIIPILAAIGVLIGVQYVGGMAAATVATIAKSAADVRATLTANALAASLARTTGLLLAQGPAANAAAAGVSRAAVAMGVMGTAGRGLVGLLGGPWGIAITAVTLGLAYLAMRTDEASNAASEHERVLRRQADAAEYGGRMSDYLRKATEAERQATINAMKAARDKAAQDILTAKAALKRAQAELALAKAQGAKKAADYISLGDPGTSLEGSNAFATISNEQRKLDPVRTSIGQLNASISSMEDSVAQLEAGIGAAEIYQTPVTSVGDPKKGKKSKGERASKGASGPSAEEIQARFNSELISITMQILSARSSMALNAEDRADEELKMVEMARTQSLNDLKNNKDYNATQRKRINEHIDRLAEVERERVERAKQQQLLQEQNELARVENEIRADDLRAQMDMAESSSERRDIALKLIDLSYELEKAELQRLIASEAVADADKEIARRRLASLEAAKAHDVDRAKRDNESPLERYRREINMSAGKMQDAMDDIAVQGLKNLNDQLVDAIMNSKNLGEVFSNVAKSIVADLLRIAIQQAVIKPLADSLFGQQGAGGQRSGGSLSTIISGIGSFVGGLFGGKGGKATGGPSVGMTLVGENGPEVLSLGGRPSWITAAQNIPKIAGVGSQSGGVATVRLELSGDIEARMVGVAQGVSVQIVNAAAPTIRDAAVNETFRRSGRPKM